jgi:hypothetical protein
MHITMTAITRQLTHLGLQYASGADLDAREHLTPGAFHDDGININSAARRNDVVSDEKGWT